MQSLASKKLSKEHLQKMRDGAIKFAVDSASYIEMLQAFKGPALKPKAFACKVKAAFEV